MNFAIDDKKCYFWENIIELYALAFKIYKIISG